MARPRALVNGSERNEYENEVQRNSTHLHYAPPFSLRPLHDGGDDSNSKKPPPNGNNDEWLLSLLPASFRTKSDNLVAAGRDIQACVEEELDLRRLAIILDWLWVAGRPVPPRPLHQQILLSREVFVTERMDMHLVWTTGRIFIKPLPRFLLDPRFWTWQLSCSPRHCRCPAEDGKGKTPRWEQKLWKRALGFLFSYVALITHESDFLMAKEKLLLPSEVTWQAWRTLVHELDTENIYPSIDRRFIYGELRLSRLNKIYYLTQLQLRGYTPRWQQYSTYFRNNFAWVASGTVYIVVVLTAMQVGLATDTLVGNRTFQSASYGFTVFSILGPLVAAGLIIIGFCVLFVANWIDTIIHNKKRLHSIRQMR